MGLELSTLRPQAGSSVSTGRQDHWGTWGIGSRPSGETGQNYEKLRSPPLPPPFVLPTFSGLRAQNDHQPLLQCSDKKQRHWGHLGGSVG